ncbi:alpha/beta fold hydrolase [Streptomyces varsoviensis]|uniref:alpha/beta fold hydrolase n=1 Tax=Streptomyces varsoviensis TaxID=67373 RepID=UPI00340E7197
MTMFDELPPFELAFPGPLRDQLVAAVLSGAKTATTGLLREYELAGDPLPEVGERSAVIDSAGLPVAVIEVTEVRVVPLGEIDEAFARAEGEGHETVAAWRADHESFWHGPRMRQALGDPHFTVSDGTPVVACRFMVVECGRVPVENGELYYEAAGSGPALVLLHGGMLDMSMWDEQFTRLARAGRRVIRYDARGHGRSSVSDGDWSDHDDLYALLDHLRVVRATLVGHSSGARIAVDTAIAHPGVVAALVLLAPGLSGSEITDPYIEKQLQEQATCFGAPDGAERFVEHYLRMWVDGPYREPAAVDPVLRERIGATAAATVTLNVTTPTMGRAIEAGAMERLHEIQVPTVALVGELDSGDVAGNLAEIVSAVPGARAVVVPGAGHLVHLEGRASFEQSLDAFLLAHPWV